MKRTVIFDIETYHGFFYIGMLRVDDMLRRGFEMSSRQDVGAQREDVRKFLHQYQTVGYNSLTYDLPMIWYWLDGADNAQLKRASDRIIKGNVRRWDVEDMLGIKVPWKVKQQHIDLIEPQPNAFASLKILNARLHGRQLQDLPFDPDLTPTDAQKDVLANYCLHSDLDATLNVFNALEAPLDLRRHVGRDIGIDLMSKSDTQMGLAIIKARIEAKTGRKVGRSSIKEGFAFRYVPPAYISFKTPQLVEMVEHISVHDFIVRDNGKIELPKWLSSQKYSVGASIKYSVGIGGLHSTESNRSVRPDSKHVLCDWDVTSYYPRIILSLGLFPDATGREFLDVYRGILSDRVKAKRSGDKVTDKSMKIALNGTFGSLGSRYSFVYAPHLLIAVTLTGQLAILMLIERMHSIGIETVSANTDGVVLMVPRPLWGGLDNTDRPIQSPLAEVIHKWERDTGFNLEGTEYSALFNQSVNAYFALKPNGGHKRKGPIGNPWSNSSSENDLRSQMMKNPQASVCSDAALSLIKHGTPVETTIRNCQDIRQFVSVIKATGGAEWRGEYLGKVVRFYWSTDGDPIVKVKANPKSGTKPKVPKTDGARPCMMLPDFLPDDIDYTRYIAEAKGILNSIGYYGNVPLVMKPVRLTKRNRIAVLNAWMTAA